MTILLRKKGMNHNEKKREKRKERKNIKIPGNIRRKDKTRREKSHHPLLLFCSLAPARLQYQSRADVS